MPDLKFACPNCAQHIQAESGYAGMQIACPACGAAMTVPGLAAVSAPRPIVQAPPPPAPATATSGCPSCGAPLPRGAVLCTKCGYNLATRQRTVAGRPAALGSAMAPSGETKWYLTAYPYVAVVLVVLAVLYYLGRSNPAMMLAFLGTSLVYSLTVHIIVVVAAFRESVGTGFLTMCVPFYAIYFVFKVSENQTLQILYSVVVILNLVLRFLAKS